jgi:hypothetical protein
MPPSGVKLSIAAIEVATSENSILQASANCDYPDRLLVALVVVARRPPRPHRDRRARLGDELLGRLIKTDEWSRRIMRVRINLL